MISSIGDGLLKTVVWMNSMVIPTTEHLTIENTNTNIPTTVFDATTTKTEYVNFDFTTDECGRYKITNIVPTSKGRDKIVRLEFPHKVNGRVVYWQNDRVLDGLKAHVELEFANYVNLSARMEASRAALHAEAVAPLYAKDELDDISFSGSVFRTGAILPEDIQYPGTGVRSVFESMFYGCTNLRFLQLGETLFVNLGSNNNMPNFVNVSNLSDHDRFDKKFDRRG